MKDKQRIEFMWSPHTLRRVLGTFSIAAALLLGSLGQPTTAHPAFTDFSADIDGMFMVSGANGESPLFVVEESGTGYETTLGGFTYTTYLLHNLARVPEGCGFNSSTGVEGIGVFNFPDGQMRLERISSSSCFAFPLVVLEESWRIASGTGAYVGTTGKLVRTFTGDVRTGMGFGAFTGTIKM
jgi:hypothetical protein